MQQSSVGHGFNKRLCQRSGVATAGAAMFEYDGESVPGGIGRDETDEPGMIALAAADLCCPGLSCDGNALDCSSSTGPLLCVDDQLHPLTNAVEGFC